jgi:SAM-dependent methyltransferase
MDIDVTDLRAFYASPLGRVVRRTLAQRIRERWRKADGQVVFGLGYTTPYLGSFRGEAARLGALMPAHMGGLVWPDLGVVRTVMVDESRLPLGDNGVDRLLMVHCLETAGGQARTMLREAWRILAPEGRILIVVPNRSGPWARRDATPFGHGQPYSRSQLERLLVDTMFHPLDWGHAIFVPPIDRRMIVRASRPLERVGRRLWPLFSAVLVVEARKELAQPLVEGVAAKRLWPALPISTSPVRQRSRDPVA